MISLKSFVYDFQSMNEKRSERKEKQDGVIDVYVVTG